MGFGADLLKMWSPEPEKCWFRTPHTSKICKLLPVCLTNNRRRSDHISEPHAKFRENRWGNRSTADLFTDTQTDRRKKLIVYPMHWIDPLISFFPSVSQSVSQSVCLLTDQLSNDYVYSSLPIFTKFCMRLRNVVVSSPIVCEKNRK